MSQWTRREFVKRSAKGVALAAIPMIFKLNPSAAFATPAGSPEILSAYFEHFGVDDKVIKEVIQTAMSKGGSYCDLFFQHSIGNTIVLEDNIVSRAYSNIDFGVGIRVLSGDQTGFSFTEELSPKAMKLAAATAANIANDSRAPLPVDLQFHMTPNYYPIKTKWEDIGIDQKIPYLQKINDRMVALDKRVIKSKVYFIDNSSSVMTATSDGRIVADYRPMVMVYATATAEQNGKRETNSYSMGGRDGIELFTPENVNKIADEAVKRTVNLFNAVKPEGGEMEVVLAAGSSGILLHEAIGHGMEADFNRKEISIFSDKIGKPVAEKFVNIVDDGTWGNARGALNVDDEGNDTEKTFLVEDGKLRTYLHDRISAKHYKINPTGNGRRESFRHPPMPRMRCTYMLPGPHKKDEIIQSVKKGIYAESFTNGEVAIGAGDFTFYVKTGYEIENGKLTRPIKDINIIGNGPEVLKNITMVADDATLDVGGWTCGKNGQSVPVSQGLPTVKVSSITVGGVSS